MALGFDNDCHLDLVNATRRFDKAEFWKAITGSNDCSDPKTDEIHNPTLRLIRYQMAITFLPGSNVQVLYNDELRLLYAMTKKIKVSPAKMLVHFWLGIFHRSEPIFFTTFITRIAKIIDLLNGKHYFEYIASPRDVVTEDFFISTQVLKRDENGDIKMIYPGHTAEISLLCERRRFYALCTLTINWD